MVQLVGQVAIPLPAHQDRNQPHLLPGGPLTNPAQGVLDLCRVDPLSFPGKRQPALGAGDPGDLGPRQFQKAGEIGVAAVKQQQRPGGQRCQDLGPSALVAGLGIGLIPELARQPTG